MENILKSTTPNKYLTLLRGINVGGKNIIKMDELKKLFEELGFSNVKTYIQSGNIIFDCDEKDKMKLTEKIEKALFKKLNKEISTIVLTSSEAKEIVNKKPKGFGEDKEYKYDVIYFVKPLTPKTAIKEIKAREGVDNIYLGKNVLYVSRLIKNLTKSYLPRIIENPIYKSISIRNWNTTEKICEMMASIFSFSVIFSLFTYHHFPI